MRDINTDISIPILSDAEHKAQLHARVLAILKEGLPYPHFPPKEELLIANSERIQMEKRKIVKVGWRNVSKKNESDFKKGVQGEWFAMCSAIAGQYWGIPAERKSKTGEVVKYTKVLEEHTKAIDWIILKKIHGSWVKHDQLTQQEFAFGLLILKKWGDWLDNYYLKGEEEKAWDAGLDIHDEYKQHKGKKVEKPEPEPIHKWKREDFL